ncbi:hypothetical protein [Embleya sp. NPDC005575]|uniref:hypothetical protein n=1 Tax=Embleya sp. NPDC005575 TaxID=3156892 RepID=UPI0033A18F0D
MECTDDLESDGIPLGTLVVIIAHHASRGCAQPLSNACSVPDEERLGSRRTRLGH